MATPATIALVDDDTPVRRLFVRTLRQEGYDVLAAASGAEALTVASHYAGAIDLLVTDVVMTPMDGVQLADEMAARDPPPKVLLVSGYADHPRIRSALSRAGRDFLLKPFGRDELAQTVARLLATPALATPRPADALTCPACGDPTAGEVVGILIGSLDSDWRVCGACRHLWSVNPHSDLFPLLLGSPTHRATMARDHLTQRGRARDPRFRVRLPARYRTSDREAWHGGHTEDLSRSGLLLRVGRSPEVTRLLTCAAPIELRVEVPYGATSHATAVIACLGDVVRSVDESITADQSGVAVAVRSYRLADVDAR